MLDVLDRMARDELIAYARRLGVNRPELLTRVELKDEIIRVSASDDSQRKRLRGWLGVARDLVASVVEQGLHLPDAAALIRGGAGFEIAGNNPGAVATVTLAEIYAAQGHVRRALGMLDEVLEKEPDHEPARSLRSRLSQQEEGRRATRARVARIGEPIEVADAGGELPSSDTGEVLDTAWEAEPRAALASPETIEPPPSDAEELQLITSEWEFAEEAHENPIAAADAEMAAEPGADSHAIETAPVAEAAPPETLAAPTLEPAAEVELEAAPDAPEFEPLPEAELETAPEARTFESPPEVELEAAPVAPPAHEVPEAPETPPSPAAVEPSQPERAPYAVDALLLIRDGERLQAYWQVGRETLAQVRQKEPQGRLVLKVVSLRPHWEGAERRERELALAEPHGFSNLELDEGPAVVRAAIGWQTGERFRPLAIAEELEASADAEPLVRRPSFGRPLPEAQAAEFQALCRWAVERYRAVHARDLPRL